MNILYNDSKLLFGKIHRTFVYVFVCATCRYPYWESNVLESNLMEKNTTSQLDCFL